MRYIPEYYTLSLQDITEEYKRKNKEDIPAEIILATLIAADKACEAYKADVSAAVTAAYEKHIKLKAMLKAN